MSQSCGLDSSPLPGDHVVLSVLRHLESSLYQEITGELGFYNLERRERREERLDNVTYLGLIFQQFSEVYTAGEHKDCQADDPGGSV